MINSDKKPGEKLRGYMVEPGQSLTGGMELQTKAVSYAKATSASTGGAMSVFEISVKRGRPPHVHQHQDEGLYVLSGRLGIRIGGDAFDAPAGTFLFLPKQTSHRFWAEEDDTRILLFTTPGGIEVYETAHLTAKSPEEREEVAKKFGMRYILDAEELARPKEDLRQRCEMYGIEFPSDLEKAD